MHPLLDAALAAGHGVVARRDHPTLVGMMDGALRRGELVSLLAGVYCRPADATDLTIRARAVCVADPAAVITGRAAAIVAGRSDVPAPEVIVVASRTLRGPVPGYRFERRAIDPVLVRRLRGVRFTAKALTALDLALDLGEGQLDEALRRGIDPADLRDALRLSPNRRGYARLRRVVDELRDRPWSPLERRAHELLRQARVDGWLANRAVYDDHGDRLGFGDLVFGAYGLVLELDGASYHRDAAKRADDGSRDLRFERAGWEVIRFGGSLVTDDPERFVAIVRDLLRTRAWRCGVRTAVRRPNYPGRTKATASTCRIGK